MGERSADVLTYLPASLLRALSARRPSRVPWCREIQGTMVMADLSGFTALSERLARLGDEGAERLTAVIDTFFERMLRTASHYGGDTLTFGGDAILLLFDGEQHASRAVAASLAMLKQVERAAAVDAGDGKVKLGMSVGAHSGTFLLTAAGLAEERVRLFVLGRGAEVTALAEAQAERGQLAVSAPVKDLLAGDAEVSRSGDYWTVQEVAGHGPVPEGREPPPVSALDGQQAAPFLPPYARTTVAEDGALARLTPEHRRVCVVFVNILGVNRVIETAGVDAALEQLQTYACLLTRLSVKHHGFVVSSDIATRGSKLVVAFGAPVAHEYAAANAARFALDLNAELRRSGLDLRHRLGVNGGHVFAGEVGPSFRRQYTVMGDAVNLAARLMAAAEPGEAYVSRDLLDHAGPGLCGRELPPIKVKGKEKPVAVCVLEEERRGADQIHGRTRRDRAEGNLFGRRTELDLIRRSWEEARRGDGRALLIEGEAGVGKTRLLEEALRVLPDTVRVTRAACFDHLQAAPFTPWVDVLHAILGTRRDGPTGRRSDTVQAYLQARLPDLVELGSLLDPLLNMSVPQGQVVRSLDAQARRRRLFELVARMLAEAAGDGGHVVVVEDLHWADESSLALVRHVAQRVGTVPILLLLTSRPTGSPLDLGAAQVTRIVLAELSRSESLAMIREALGVADLPTEVGEAVYVKTRGNPLFLEEVIHSLQAPGLLEHILGESSVARAADMAALAIPDRVQGLLMSRIDRLPPDTREVLKAGSVIGRTFDEQTLSGVDDALLGPIALDRAFDELLASDLVVRGDEATPRAVAFRHALVQDVAYGSLPFARRRDLHGRVARYLETTQASPDHGLLVHHYLHSGDRGNTRLHAVRASASSVAVSANREAVDYLTLALDTARGRTSREACLRSRLEEMTGDCLESLARHDDAIERFVLARRRWVSPTVRDAAEDALRELAPIDDGEGRDSALCWKIAVAAERGPSSFRRALQWLDRATCTLPAGREGLAARILITRSAVLSRLGRFADALRAGEEGVVLARQDGDAALQAYALTTLTNTFWGLGLLERAIEVNKEAVALYEQVGDLAGQGNSHGNLASTYQIAGDLQAALQHHELALAFHARLSYTTGVAITQCNLGELLLQMGDTEGALEHLQEAVRPRAEQGIRPDLTGFALINLSRARLRQGDLEPAEQAVAEGRELLRSISAQGLLLDVTLQQAEVELARGALAKAERSCRTALTGAQAMGADLCEAQALCLLGRIRLAQGEPEEAIPGLETCVALAGKNGSDYERAQALAVLAEVRASCGDAHGACEGPLCEAIRLFEQMGARYDLDKAVAVRERLEATGLGTRQSAL